MTKILAIYGSPRKNGNTAILTNKAVEGAIEKGADVKKIYLHELNMMCCNECYTCKENGRCGIDDDFQQIYDNLIECDGIILSSPIFFYAVSAQIKILMDRCQSLWVRKYWVEKVFTHEGEKRKKGIFISVGATKGEHLFDGALLTVKYFFDALDTELYKTLLYKEVDNAGDILKRPESLKAAYDAGKELAMEINK